MLAASLVWTAGSGAAAFARELPIPTLNQSQNFDLVRSNTSFGEDDTAQALVDRLCTHERLSRRGRNAKLRLANGALIPPDYPNPDAERHSEPTDEQVDFGSFNMPFGHFSLLTRELDSYGRLRGVQFLKIEEPGSPWRFEIGVHHGASLRLRRSWTAARNDRPFASRDKGAWLGD